MKAWEDHVVDHVLSHSKRETTSSREEVRSRVKAAFADENARYFKSWNYRYCYESRKTDMRIWINYAEPENSTHFPPHDSLERQHREGKKAVTIQGVTGSRGRMGPIQTGNFESIREEVDRKAAAYRRCEENAARQKKMELGRSKKVAVKRSQVRKRK